MKQHLVRFMGILLIVAFASGLASGLAVGQANVLASIFPRLEAASAGPDYNLIGQAWDTINRVYVDRPAIKPLDLTYGAISGMTDALGDTGHSRFLTPDMVREQQSFVQGKFQGIGAEVEMKDGAVTIVSPFDNSPAQKAGLRPGDVIEKVDGQNMMGLQLHDVVQKLLGKAGTQVTITVLTPKTGRTRDLTLTRQEITIQEVTWQQIPGTTIAHLRIASFSQSTETDLRQALTQIQQQQLTGIILDLRDNPGGLLNESVLVTSQFVTDGNVVLVKDAAGKETPLPVKSGGVATTIPMVVLINGGTASASEIVSGAIQDAHRATLIGSKTFGTGTVLQQYPLSDGSALLLATGEWLTPAGRVIWHNGISPDIDVPLDPNVSPLFPGAERNLTAAEVQASNDQQLLRAMAEVQSSHLPEVKVPGNAAPAGSASLPDPAAGK
jgi:carboxyl-terminal processing protease